jgi:hypothetical protein
MLSPAAIMALIVPCEGVMPPNPMAAHSSTLVAPAFAACSTSVSDEQQTSIFRIMLVAFMVDVCTKIIKICLVAMLFFIYLLGWLYGR